MIVALYIFLALVVVGTLLYLLHRRDLRLHGPEESDSAPQPQPEEEECCGMHITCEKDSLLAGVSADIVYYDDEELDFAMCSSLFFPTTLQDGRAAFSFAVSGSPTKFVRN